MSLLKHLDSEEEENTSSSSSEEEEEEEEESSEEEDDDIIENEDEEEVEEPQEDVDYVEEGEEVDFEFDDNKKKTKRKVKKQIQYLNKSKKKILNTVKRELPNYYSLEIRNTTKAFIMENVSQDEKVPSKLEKAIYNCAVRETKNLNITTLDSYIFKNKYLEIFQYVLGVINNNSLTSLVLQDIMESLKNNKYLWDSNLYTELQVSEEQEQEKLSHPLDVQEDPNYRCGKCKGIKVFKYRDTTRGADEATSLKVFCANKECGNRWTMYG